MADAVAKNMKVEFLGAEELGSNHIPHHILCKAYTCEKLDECNELTLTKLEQKLKLRDIIERREPRLKSFIRKSKAVTKAAIITLIGLVTKGVDGKSVSLADKFDVILEEDGVSMTYRLCKEKVYEIGIYGRSNLMVRACKLYLESEFVMAALKALSYFTNQVTIDVDKST